ncbi:hypothetical protein SCHPADRAFT_503796 [Schizopora paradoxa]|uniref:Uncharacterized protein n=1 Tax=Schizopora paradoxa TaxID=27342 RepID=A0A0H2RGM1_9AGAM|nr:hypothetical protein SCHPADRAFT_503796 [Schizopora paradoxa]
MSRGRGRKQLLCTRSLEVLRMRQSNHWVFSQCTQRNLNRLVTFHFIVSLLLLFGLYHRDVILRRRTHLDALVCPTDVAPPDIPEPNPTSLAISLVKGLFTTVQDAARAITFGDPTLLLLNLLLHLSMQLYEQSGFCDKQCWKGAAISATARLRYRRMDEHSIMHPIRSRPTHLLMPFCLIDHACIAKNRRSLG